MLKKDLHHFYEIPILDIKFLMTVFEKSKYIKVQKLSKYSHSESPSFAVFKASSYTKFYPLCENLNKANLIKTPSKTKMKNSLLYAILANGKKLLRLQFLYD
jgi:hypothetical protein